MNNTLQVSEHDYNKYFNSVVSPEEKYNLDDQYIFNISCENNNLDMIRHTLSQCRNVDIWQGIRIAEKNKNPDLMKALLKALDEQNKNLSRRKPTPRLFCIIYNVYGADHDGYCSGEEADEEDYETWTECKYILSSRDLDKLTDISEFDDVLEGCSSVENGGSGYCQGFMRKYTVNKISRIDDTHFDTDHVMVFAIDENGKRV